jgi:hypothetical protein
MPDYEVIDGQNPITGERERHLRANGEIVAVLYLVEENLNRGRFANFSNEEFERKIAIRCLPLELTRHDVIEWLGEYAQGLWNVDPSPSLDLFSFASDVDAAQFSMMFAALKDVEPEDSSAPPSQHLTKNL